MSQHNSTRTCYICLMAEDEGDTEDKWVHPCRCRGTTKWCHETCILRWIEEKQRDNTDLDTFPCPVCHTAIVVIHPRMNLSEKLCELVDRIATRLSPLGSVAVGIGAVYWAALGFGAATYVQMCGTEAAVKKWNDGDQLVILIALPSIPLALLVTRLFNWEEAVLERWRRNYQYLPKFLRPLLPIDNSSLRSSTMQLAQVRTRRSYSRMLCSAFIFPSGSVLCGRLFLPHLRSSRVRQSLFGCLVYVALKGMLTIYTKHAQWLQRARRAVQNYSEPESEAQARRSRRGNSHRNSITPPDTANIRAPESPVNFPFSPAQLTVIDDFDESVRVPPADTVVLDTDAL